MADKEQHFSLKLQEILRKTPLKLPIVAGQARYELRAGGKPSTWFPPGGLVEQSDLSKQHRQEQQGQEQTNKQTNKKTNTQTTKQTSKQTNKRTNKQANKHVNKLIN